MTGLFIGAACGLLAAVPFIVDAWLRSRRIRARRVELDELHRRMTAMTAEAERYLHSRKAHFPAMHSMSLRLCGAKGLCQCDHCKEWRQVHGVAIEGDDTRAFDWDGPPVGGYAPMPELEP